MNSGKVFTDVTINPTSLVWITLDPDSGSDPVFLRLPALNVCSSVPQRSHHALLQSIPQQDLRLDWVDEGSPPLPRSRNPTRCQQNSKAARFCLRSEQNRRRSMKSLVLVGDVTAAAAAFILHCKPRRVGGTVQVLVGFSHPGPVFIKEPRPPGLFHLVVVSSVRVGHRSMFLDVLLCAFLFQTVQIFYHRL